MKTLKKAVKTGFSSPMKLICSTDTGKERLKSATRYPNQSIFNMTDSKAKIVQNSSLPTKSSHLYALTKGLYSSQTQFNSDCTRTESLPNNNPPLEKAKSMFSGFGGNFAAD